MLKSDVDGAGADWLGEFDNVLLVTSDEICDALGAPEGP